VKRPIAYLAATGRGIPSTVFMNSDFASIGIETTDQWIVERTGIKQRHIAKTESTTDLAATAARSAMDKAKVHAGELDLIVLGTASPDRLLPSAAVDLQAALGASRAAAFDVGAACSGFIYSATVAEAMMATGAYETALVVGVEKLSAITDWQDRSTCVLFGDGAGAAILKRSKHHKGILSSYVRSDGTLGDLLCRPSGDARFSSTPCARWRTQLRARSMAQNSSGRTSTS
jgi:3-oxoacyl-[acyl-carrier-protein] synthase-3